MLSIALVIAVDANSAHATLQERKRKRTRKSKRKRKGKRKRKRKRKTWRKEGRKEGRKIYFTTPKTDVFVESVRKYFREVSTVSIVSAR